MVFLLLLSAKLPKFIPSLPYPFLCGSIQNKGSFSTTQLEGSTMYITKGQGALYTMLPVSLYVIPYYGFVSGNGYTLELLALFTFGVLFLFLVKIEPGTQGQLLWFEKLVRDTNGRPCLWEDGLCLVPTLFPFLHKVDIHLFWWIKKPITEEDYLNNQNGPYIHHHVDQREMRYNVNVDTSLFMANLQRITGNIFGWFFGITRGNPALLFQRVGTRIIILALLLGFGFNQSASQQNEKSNNNGKGTTTTPSTPHTNNSSDTVTLKVQLKKQNLPDFPTKEFFTVRTEDAWIYRVVEGRKYFYYSQAPEGKIPAMIVDDSRCVAVPAGREIKFITKFVPTYAANMKNKIIYARKSEEVDLLKKAVLFIVQGRIPDSNPYYLMISWTDAYEEWNAFDTSAGFVAQALTLDEIPDNVQGGLVCF